MVVSLHNFCGMKLKKNNNIIRVFEHKEKMGKEHPIPWYDPLYKKLLTFQGLFLDFEIKEEKYIETKNGKISLEDAVEEVRKYNRTSLWQAKKIVDDNCDIIRKYRLFPKVIKDKKELKQTKVLQWFEKYKNYNNTTMYVVEESKNDVIFSGEKKDFDDFTNELSRSGFRFEG